MDSRGNLWLNFWRIALLMIFLFVFFFCWGYYFSKFYFFFLALFFCPDALQPLGHFMQSRFGTVHMLFSRYNVVPIDDDGQKSINKWPITIERWQAAVVTVNTRESWLYLILKSRPLWRVYFLQNSEDIQQAFFHYWCF